MAWVPVVEKLKEALLDDINWAAAETQIDQLSKSDHPRDIFQNLTLNGIPALQFIAHRIPWGIDIDRMDKVVKTITDSGYDINQQPEWDSRPGYPSRKFTALFAAVHAQNYHLVRSLLRHGARTDIRDAVGYSPLHGAIIGACRDIFDLLLDFGASVTSSERERNGEEGKTHPLLHTAVDRGDPRMVSFLLRKGILDVNEKAVYTGVEPWTTTQTFTPLGRALRRFDTAIFWNLLNQPGILAELEDIEYCLVKGNASLATSLIGKLPDLCWVTIGGVEDGVPERVPSLLWLFHSISSGLSLPESFEPRVQFLPALASVVKEFVEKGYDLNLTWKSTPETPPVGREPLLHYALRIDMIGRTNHLLRVLIQLDHRQRLVPATAYEGRDCLEYLLRTWNDCCQANEGTECWRPEPSGERATCCVDTVKLLMRHGLNVNQVVIREEFKYHFGYTSMIQLLYRNGAEIEYHYPFPWSVCTTHDWITTRLERELGELKEWKETFDRNNPISLKNVCRLQVRKMMTGKEELEMLEGLPANLKEFVLKNEMD